ncbi:hypothetical protein [Spirilliplanes yamanashiensis]|uniref:Uncharacterized protein n=1 Tax=Spirilliplanes yamanashiensis TaxID=42233 RepID=A0A8J4DK35_9ACTN|nr:hypothetical protein [Spirilliplanes yamanashiensis]MDP9815629.1 hypothetical protein [Spirilliplanes yamanashiensis]GIJ03883.1 hypothetical protein Sya03_32350 [Spirilliplanes yamanashiensis]
MATATQAPRRAPRPSTTATRTTRSTATTAPAAPAASEMDDDLVPRFLNFLLPAVTAAAGHLVPKIAPQVGGAIGGLFGGNGAQIGSGVGGAIGNVVGGLFGGRAVAAAPLDVMLANEQLSRALDEQQTMQVVTTITQQCAPAVLAAVQQTMADRSARGETGDVDDETMERGWGFLTSVIADEVIKLAPAAIQAATKALGSVVGSRDVDEFTPLVVDTEMTQRFVLPTLQSLVTGVQQVLPQLFTLVSGSRATPRDTGISWQDLQATKRLWDNDNIAAQDLQPLDNPDEIEIVLELAPHKTWWKGIQLQDDNGGFIAEIGVQDRTKTASVRVRADQLLSPGGYLVFMKAKAFGVHTGMYRLATGGLDQLRGHRAHFFWYAD